MNTIQYERQRAGFSACVAAFEVRCVRTECRYTLPGRREHRVFLRIVDGFGAPVTRARIAKGGRGTGYSNRHTPGWAQGRRPKAATENWFDIGGGGGSMIGSGHHGGGTETTASYPGFDLGTHLEDGRYEHKSVSVTAHVPGHGDASLRIDGAVQRERTYLAVAVPLADVHDRVFLPSGRRAIDLGARFRVSCDAVLVTDDMPAEAWRELEIELEVKLPGYRTLERTFTLDDHDWTAVLVEGADP